MTQSPKPPRRFASERALDYQLGVRSQQDVADELGLSLRQLQRVETDAIVVFLLEFAQVLREAIGDPCRISKIVAEDVECAARAESLSGPATASFSRSDVDQRAQHLPRRFPEKRKP